MSSNKSHDCQSNPINPDVAKGYIANPVTTVGRWYAGCNHGWTGPVRSSYSEARDDAQAHQAETGHGTGVLGG